MALDEMWTFVGRKKRKVWLWLAVQRASRRIAACTLGCPFLSAWPLPKTSPPSWLRAAATEIKPQVAAAEAQMKQAEA